MPHEPLIIKVYRPTKEINDQGTIKIYPAAAKALEQLQRQTGLSIRYLASLLIEYAADKVEIEEK